MKLYSVWLFKTVSVQFAYREVDEFMDDLEEDQTLRQNVNIYFNPRHRPPQSERMDPDTPRIGLDEMLQEMTLQTGAGEGMD